MQSVIAPISEVYRPGKVDTVLLQAINAVKSLGGASDLSADWPLVEAIGNAQSMAGGADNTVTAAVGGLDGNVHAGFRVEWLNNAQPTNGASTTPTAPARGDAGTDGTVQPATAAGADGKDTADAVSSPVNVQQQLLDALQSQQRQVQLLRDALDMNLYATPTNRV